MVLINVLKEVLFKNRERIDRMNIFDEYYDSHNLEKLSRYSNFSKKQLVIEAEYMHNTLSRILEYIDNGGEDLRHIYSEVMDGIYESRI